MNASTRIAVIVAGLLCHLAARAADEAPPKPVELKILERLVGSWTFEDFAKPAEWAPNGGTVTGTLTREWVLDGRYVQEKIESTTASKAIVYFTYDQQKNAYRCWHFSAAGWNFDSLMQWDAATQTFNGKSEADGKTTVSSIKFINNDVHEWRAVTTDKAGKVYFDGGGKVTRKK